ncbi:porin family protein [Aquirufa nivalisilvae]
MKFNKSLVLALIAFFFSKNSAFSQSNKFDLQLEGGPSLISVRGELFNNKASLNGFTSGFYLNYNLNKHLSIKSGISYERKGYREEFKGTTSTGQTTIGLTGYNFDYLVIPMLARVNFGNKIKFSASGGPYLGYLTSQQFFSNFPLYSTISSTNLVDNKIDLGVSTGIGCSISLSELFSISLEARNNLALMSISDVGKINTNSTNLIFGITYHISD